MLILTNTFFVTHESTIPAGMNRFYSMKFWPNSRDSDEILKFLCAKACGLANLYRICWNSTYSQVSWWFVRETYHELLRNPI